MRFFYSEKCIHMIRWIANPLCDDTACWHAALRVLRAEAAELWGQSSVDCIDPYDGLCFDLVMTSFFVECYKKLHAAAISPVVSRSHPSGHLAYEL